MKLEEVAQYLECDIEKLRTALYRLGDQPSAIECTATYAIMVVPADDRIILAAVLVARLLGYVSVDAAVADFTMRAMSAAPDDPQAAKWLN